jgi:REP element-mobilizing transposase RayT
MNDCAHSARRRPAHHPPVERFNEPVIVLATVCTHNRRPVLACAAVHRICREVWEAADFWHVGRYVIMPDHVHMFCAPGRIPMPNLRQWVEYWKGQVARRFSLISGGPTSASAGKEDDTEVVPPAGMNAERICGGPTSVSVVRADGTEPVPPEIRGGGSASVRTGTSIPFKLWQRDFWDTQMRSREHYEEKLAYVRLNPVRKGLAGTPENWPYQGEVFSLAWR